MSDPQLAIPQLQMKRVLSMLPEVVVPAGYRLRHFTPDDGEAWAGLLSENGELGAWDAARSAPYFTDDSHMALEGAFLITKGSQPVATAQLHLTPAGRFAPLPEMGWVAVSPRHQGHGLAAVVCLAVMHHAASTGHQEIFLKTDDHRLPAIWTYLKLGFSPWLTDVSHAARWDTVCAALDRHRERIRRGER